MTPELIGIISVGVTLGGGLVIVMREIADLRERMARLEGEVRGFMAGFKAQSV